MADEVPIPNEISRAAKFITTVRRGVSIDFREGQLARLESVIQTAESGRGKWANAARPDARTVTSGLKYIDIMSVMDQFNLGGAK